MNWNDDREMWKENENDKEAPVFAACEKQLSNWLSSANRIVLFSFPNCILRRLLSRLIIRLQELLHSPGAIGRPTWTMQFMAAILEASGKNGSLHLLFGIPLSLNVSGEALTSGNILLEQGPLVGHKLCSPSACPFLCMQPQQWFCWEITEFSTFLLRIISSI